MSSARRCPPMPRRSVTPGPDLRPGRAVPVHDQAGAADRVDVVGRRPPHVEEVRQDGPTEGDAGRRRRSGARSTGRRRPPPASRPPSEVPDPFLQPASASVAARASITERRARTRTILSQAGRRGPARGCITPVPARVW